MSNNYKPAIRKQKAVLGTSAKVIIALLVVIVITLAAFLIKIIASQALKPNIVYPPERQDTETEETPHTRSEDTEEETSLETRTVDGSRYDTSDGTLILVNGKTAYSMPADKEKELVNLFEERHENFTLSNSNITLSPVCYEALCRMTDSYAERYGYCPLMLTSGYRDSAAQQAFYDDFVVNESDKVYVELPGYSDHHTGLCFDVKLYDSGGNSYSYGRYATEKAAWIVENYKYYGFIMRYPANKGSLTGIEGESNHFRYVGMPHSLYITNKGICLEEYLNLLRSHPASDPLTIVTEDGDEYEVWYCPSDSLTVPRDLPYTVSGDNRGGLIVTCRK